MANITMNRLRRAKKIEIPIRYPLSRHGMRDPLYLPKKKADSGNSVT